MGKEIGSSLLEVLISLSLLLLASIALINIGSTVIQKRVEWQQKADKRFVERQERAYEQGMGRVQ